MPSKAKETSTFHLVGITDNWDVVFCGDDVSQLAGESSVARGLIASPQGPHKRTLFQDIFGDSALSMVPIDPVAQKKTAATPKPGIGKEIITNILDGPAYLIPPLETLFEPLMNHFLTPRPPEGLAASGSSIAGDEIDVMDVDEPRDSLLVSNARTERVVEAREMDALIELFRHHSVKGKLYLGKLLQTSWIAYLKPAPSPSHAQSLNGHAPDIHGNVHKTTKTTNGHSHTPKINNAPHPSAGIPISRSSPEGSPQAVPTSSPAVAGKKRKITTTS